MYKKSKKVLSNLSIPLFRVSKRTLITYNGIHARKLRESFLMCQLGNRKVSRSTTATSSILPLLVRNQFPNIIIIVTPKALSGNRITDGIKQNKKNTEKAVVAHKIFDFLIIIIPFTQITKYCNNFNGQQIN